MGTHRIAAATPPVHGALYRGSLEKRDRRIAGGGREEKEKGWSEGNESKYRAPDKKDNAHAATSMALLAF